MPGGQKKQADSSLLRGWCRAVCLKGPGSLGSTQQRGQGWSGCSCTWPCQANVVCTNGQKPGPHGVFSSYCP